MIRTKPQNRQYMVAKFWEEFENRMYEDALRVILLIQQYDEILRGEDE